MTTAYDAWVGREESRTERIDARPVQGMAATLDLLEAPKPGEALPPGWQWMYFNPTVARSGLGTDGHPQRGGFLPPIELPRRMWAGSRIDYLADVVIDTNATRTSRIAKVENKVGKRGSLWFVTVEHTTISQGQTCIIEEQDIVYREATPPAAPPVAAPVPKPERYDGDAQWGRDILPDTTLLFRYSALTFNGHRIHYDQSYAREEEGYPGLVVHGPLTATMLQQLAVEQGGGRRLSRFEFRGVAPLIAGRAFRIEGRDVGDRTLALWARGPNGELAMSATAAFH